MFPYLKLVERFVAVADAGSIQAAARRINISQPSLTKAISRIEEGFGTPLFERSGRGVRLTTAGELLYERSRIILREGMLAREQISDLVAGRSGLLRISAGTAWGYCFMPTIISELQEIFPDLKIELDIGLTALVMPALLAGELDLIVGSLEEELAVHQGIVREEIIPINFAAACGVTNPLAYQETVSLSDLASMPMVIYHDDQHLISKLMVQFDAAFSGQMNIAVVTKSLLAAMELVATGKYVVCLVEPFLRSFSSKNIKILDLDLPLPSFQSGVFFRQSLAYTEPFSVLLRKIRNVGTQVPMMQSQGLGAT